ncbi:hypothetical protein [Sorangium sp. So ce233]|uniref:hypothetical protein n=1 Tax=Sorangium sp. So ce233 TaxID=3133290 RepID=UPI003F62DD15
MISIHGKVMGLAMVVAALGTGCAADAADVELDQAGLDEAAEIDATSAALEEVAEDERGGYQAQAPSKDLFGPSKGLPSKGLPSKGMIGAQAPVGQLGQGPVGQLGQGPVGQLGQAPMGVPGQSARSFGCGFPGFFPGFGFGGGFGFGAPFNINNNNNINIIALLDELFNKNRVCPPAALLPHHHHCPHHSTGPVGLGWPSCS